MQPNQHFLNRSSVFWAYAKLISEKLNYSKNGFVKKYIEEEILSKLSELNISIDQSLLLDVLNYLNYRADLLNSSVKDLFMDVNTARTEFYKLHALHTANNFICSLPFNKQKNEKRDYAYFTGIINILTENVLREYARNQGLIYGNDISFNDNPLNLTYFTDEIGNLQGIMSRRFDGAFPNTINPIAIWEIKEYYYTTTFGSRIADGVYETQLDGFEINTITREVNNNIGHIYFLDDYNSWWNMGKPYLCRIIDMLHSGLVNEVIFGREVFERWPIIVKELAHFKYGSL